jgi:chromosome partitioning protein
MELLRDSYGSRLNIFETVIPFSVRVKECGKAGESIYKYDEKGKAAQAFEQLTREVLEYGR